MHYPGDLAAALALSALLAVSCSDPQAGTLPTPSPSPSTASVSPTPTAQTLDEALRRAVSQYVVALNAALLDPKGKTAEVDSRIHASCSCRDVVAALREEAKNGRFLDYEYTLRDLTIQQVGDLGGSVTFTIDQTAGHARRVSDRRVVKSYPASVTRYSAHFRRNGDTWLLDRLDVIK